MKAKDLLTRPDQWLKTKYATDKNGNRVPPESDGAVRFCMAGALLHAYNGMPTERRLAFGKLNEAIKEVYGYKIGVSHFNDLPSTTFAQVRRVLEIADV